MTRLEIAEFVVAYCRSYKHGEGTDLGLLQAVAETWDVHHWDKSVHLTVERMLLTLFLSACTVLDQRTQKEPGTAVNLLLEALIDDVKK